MPTVQKESLVDEIKVKLTSYDTLILTDYRGLTVKEMSALRGKLREVGAEMRIYKNTLLEIAIRELALPSMDQLLTGPTAIVFASGDPVAPAKTLQDFAKASKLLEIKGGLVENHVVDADAVKAIASLPSKEQLIANLLGTLQNPLVQTVRVLNGPAAAFARVVNAIAEQKSAAA